MAPDGELTFSAVDIPIVNYSAYKELTLFKLFTWCNSINGFAGNYDDFVKGLDISKLSNCFNKISQNYLMCPTTEIWTDTTIDQMLKLLFHHYEMGHLGNEDFPLLICDQIRELINTFSHWTETGVKGETGTPINFYVSDVDLCNSYVMFRKNGIINCSVKMFTVNYLNTYDQRFCREVENWLNTTIQRSTFFTGAAEKFRHKFFNGQRQKISYLVEKILANAKGDGYSVIV
jgi:hypothetical protein